jgi:hypothetical protein
MDRRPGFEASLVALLALLTWWFAVRTLDHFLAARLPYEDYSRLVLLYSEVFYPGIPGALISEGLHAVGVHHVLGWSTYLASLLGWIVAFAIAMGIGADRYARSRNRSSVAIAALAVVALFVVCTVFEAIAVLGM